MKVILSRKGFDSGSGGTASPILPCGTPVSLPIPDPRSRTRYQDVRVAGNGLDLGALVHGLTKGRVRPGHPAHLDPDLDHAAIERASGWMPAFGQTGAAQSHLAGCGVGVGDLFLFFGWFRDAELGKDGNWSWAKRGRQMHAMFGWMQIGEILPIYGNEADILDIRPWLKGHPHMNRRQDAANHIYVATEKLSVPGLTHLPGAGTFKALTDVRTLTDLTQSKRSFWALPNFLHPETGTKLSYHEDATRWSRENGKVRLQSAARGQEFIINAQAKPLNAWLKQVFA